MADPTSARGLLEAELIPILPTERRIIPEQRLPGSIDVMTVMLKHMEIEPLPEQPMSWVKHTFVVTVADPHEDWVKSEDALDDAVSEFIRSLDTLQNVVWASAKKVLVSENLPYLGWDINLTMNTKKKEAS